MNPSISRGQRQKIFVWVVLGCIALAVGYTSWVILRANDNVNTVSPQTQGTPLPIAGLNELRAIQKGPHLLYLNQEEPYIGKVRLTDLDPAFPQRAQTELECGRVHYAAGTGICLMYDPASPD